MTVVVGLLLSFIAIAQCLRTQGDETQSMLDFRQRLQKLAELPPDPCGPASGLETNWDCTNDEYHLFSRAARMVVDGLNAPTANPEPPKDRAAQVLKLLEQVSGGINASWPEENRFQFQILDVAPALVVKMTIRTQARYFVFGIPEEEISGGANRLWQEVGSDSVSLEHASARSLVELFPLRRGPSGDARFLAKIEYFGCAGSIGVVYEASEWDPRGLGNLSEVTKQEGAFGLDSDVPGFPQIGRLSTEGSLITLPYCWFSVIDTWDNPSLCAVDTYALSGDTVRFRSRVYNRPDLVPIAKVIQYAQQRDYFAVLGYCPSSQLARRMVRELPPHIFAGDVRVILKGKGKERVELTDGAYRFDVKKSGARWIVVGFHME